jgi:phage I-like protein
VTALKAKSDNYDTLATELETVKADKLAAEATALLDEAVKDGRVTHAKRTEFETLHKECGIKALKTCLSALPKASAPAAPPSAPAAGSSAATAYSPDALKMMARLGVKPDDIAAHKAALRAQRGISTEQE